MSSSAIRTLVDPADPKDWQRSTRCRMRSGRPAGRAGNVSKCPNGIRRARRRCVTPCWSSPRRFPTPRACSARREQVDPVRRLIGAASAWGGNPEKDALYLNVTPARMTARPSTGSTSRTCRSTASGRSASTMRRAISSRTPLNAYTLNNITAKKGADGSIAIQFGGCDGKTHELPADHAGMELPGPALSAEAGNPRRQMDFPIGAAGVLRPPRDCHFRCVPPGLDAGPPRWDRVTASHIIRKVLLRQEAILNYLQPILSVAVRIGRNRTPKHDRKVSEIITSTGVPLVSVFRRPVRAWRPGINS